MSELIQSLAFIEESGGTRKNLLTGMTMTTCVIHCILGCIGIPLNRFAAYAIVTVDELRRQTRYILLLGMLLGNILIFVILFDEVAYYVSPSEELCQFYRALLGLPYLIFSLNYLLVLVDNYVAITRPALHLTRFTVRNVVPFQIGLTIFVCCIAKLLYIVGVLQLSCEPYFQSRILGISTLALLIVSCAILKIVIFIKTKKIISGSNQSGASSVDDIEMAGDLDRKPGANNQQQQQQLRAHTTEEATAKQEKKAMRALMFSVISLLIVYIPRLLFALSEYICIKIHPGEEEEGKCNFLDARPFMAEFTALHGIIQPIFFLRLCDQFWTAWHNRHR